MAWPDWPRPPYFTTDLRHCPQQCTVHLTLLVKRLGFYIFSLAYSSNPSHTLGYHRTVFTDSISYFSRSAVLKRPPGAVLPNGVVRLKLSIRSVRAHQSGMEGHRNFISLHTDMSFSSRKVKGRGHMGVLKFRFDADPQRLVWLVITAALLPSDE